MVGESHHFPKALAWALAFAASVGWSDSVQAQSVERIEMRPGDFGDDAWFLEPFVAETWEQDPPDNYVRERNVSVGRFDLNDDGIKEIFLTVQSGYYCGTVGCPSIVLQRRGQSWTKISDGYHGGSVLDERVCGYRSLVSRDGIERWNGERYRFAYCFPWENQCRSLAIEYDLPNKPLLQWFDPKNGLLNPNDCPHPRPTAEASTGSRISTASRAVAGFSPLFSSGGSTRPRFEPGDVFDLLPNRFGVDAAFIETVVAKSFEPDPLPDRYSRDRNIHTGRLDLNGDGSEELFIANYHSDACQIDTFIDGCPFLLFQREDSGWREIGKGRLRYAVFLLDEEVDGYRTIRGQGANYRWNGERYEAVSQ